MISRDLAAGTAHVLIVEDNEEVADAMQVVMESAGHAVSTAGTVHEAVSIAMSAPVDVMLLDLTLPDGNGLDVLLRLELANRLPSHTIALTGRDEESVRERCIAIGCGEVMIKPVPIRELVTRVNELIGVR